MRIAYSCAGEGFGHAARMVALYNSLQTRYNVELFVPDSIRAFIKERLFDVSTHYLPCFHFARKGNKIKYLSTAKEALKVFATLLPTIQKLARSLKQKQIDLVLSDFDPFLPFAAKSVGIPVIQMNHPGIVRTHIDFFNPISWLTGFFTGLLEGPHDKRIIISFYDGTVGPILRSSLLQYPIVDKGFLVVNLKKEIRDRIIPVLDSIPHLKYQLYPTPGGNFDKALASCSAVLSGAGHQTISEALCLGKPVLALPQRGHYEQSLNAKMLKKTGRGTFCSIGQLADQLPLFLEQLPQYRKPTALPAQFCLRDSRSELLAILDAAIMELTAKKQHKLEPSIKKAV